MKSTFAGFLGALALCVFAPGSASASTVTPIQVLPPGQNACAAIVISGIQAHVYDGSFDSFDFTISDPSYVTVAASAGDVFVPFYYMTRWMNTDGSLRMHVDVPSQPQGPNATIQVTLLGTKTDQNGQPITCAYALSGFVTGLSAGSSSVPQPTEPKESPMPIPTPQPATTTATTTEITPGSATTTEEGTQNPGIVTAASSMNNLCIVGSAAKLWVLLLILYAIFAVTLMAQRLDETSPRTREWNIALILAVFIGLLLFWYVSAQCRTGPWAPAIATLIAVVGLVATMLKPQIHQQILLLKEPRK